MKGILIGTTTALIASVVGLLFYVIVQMEVEHLIGCSSGEVDNRIPAPLCEYYLLNHRVTDDDVERIEQGFGLDFILNSENPNRFVIAERFIEQGLDIDGSIQHADKDIPALHAAVLYNDVKRARFLIDQGADLNRVSEHYGMTPAELAQHLQSRDETENRQELIELLVTYED